MSIGSLAWDACEKGRGDIKRSTILVQNASQQEKVWYNRS